MSWILTEDKPIYLQLMEQIKLKIISGEFPLGGRIPAVRELAFEAAVNPNTMQKALTLLESEGLLYSQRTTGRFITEDSSLIKTVKDEFALEQLQEFVNNMKAMGYEKKETVLFFQQMIEKEWNK